MTITINATQLPVTALTDLQMSWNCEEYMITYDRKTRVLTVEDFEGFDDDGAEITRVCGEAEAIAALKEHKPGWPGLDGFVLLLDYYADFWTIGTEAI
jgi:hypothetical protein